MEIRIHIGAHKTGTTRLHGELNRRRAELAARGISLYGPKQLRAPSTRAFRFQARVPAPVARVAPSDTLRRAARAVAEARAMGRRRVILMEENYAGQIDDILRNGRLYRHIRRRLALFGPLLEGHRVTILFATRSYAGIAASLYAHAAIREPQPPFAQFKQRFLALPRRWPGILAELAAALPGAQIATWRFEDLAADLAAPLRAITGEADFPPAPAPLRGRVALPSPSAEAVRVLNAMRGPDAGSPEERWAVRAAYPQPDYPRFSPWSADEASHLDACYREDMGALADTGWSRDTAVPSATAGEARHGC